MLVRSRSLSGQCTTLKISVVAISDLGPLSGCGYGLAKERYVFYVANFL
jgi:hypothetical protein